MNAVYLLPLLVLLPVCVGLLLRRFSHKPDHGLHLRQTNELLAKRLSRLKESAASAPGAPKAIDFAEYFLKNSNTALEFDSFARAHAHQQLACSVLQTGEGLVAGRVVQDAPLEQLFDVLQLLRERKFALAGRALEQNNKLATTVAYNLALNCQVWLFRSTGRHEEADAIEAG